MQVAVIYAIGWTLLHSLWQGALLALVVYSVLRWVKLSPQAKYTLTSLAQLSMVGMAAITFGLVYDQAPAPMITLGEIPAVPLGQFTNPSPESVRTFSDFLQPYLPWLTWVWVIGVSIAVLKGVFHFFQVQDLRFRQAQVLDFAWQQQLNQLGRRLGLSKTLLMLESNKIQSPLTLGHFKPVVLVPVGLLTNLPPAQVEAILAHEVAHIARHDFLINLCQTFIEALFFYHPVVWWLSQQVREAREHCCDDIAVALIDDKMTYARALTAVANHHITPTLSMAMQGPKGQLIARVKRLFGTHTPQRRLPLRALTSMLMLVAFLSFAWVSPETVAQLPPHQWAQTFAPPTEIAAVLPVEPVRPVMPVAPVVPAVPSTPTPSAAPVAPISPLSFVFPVNPVAPAQVAPPILPLFALVDTPPMPPIPPMPPMENLPPMPPMPPMPAMPPLDLGDIDWDDEEQVSAFKEKMDEFGVEMDAWGEKYGTQMEKWGEQYGKQMETVMTPQWEEFGRQMEAWGEEFGRQFSDQQGIAIKEQALREAERGLAEAQRELARQSTEQSREQQEAIREAQRAIRESQRALQQQQMEQQREIREQQRQLQQEQRLQAEEIRKEMEIRRQEEQLQREEMRTQVEEIRAMQDDVQRMKGEVIGQLKADRLIDENTKRIKVSLTKSYMKVNGKKASSATHRKYMKLLRAQGIDLADDEQETTIYFKIK